MTNVNIQGAINLFGRGHVEKAGAYQPGELKNCKNLVISEDGYLTNRPSIKSPSTFDSNFSLGNPVAAIKNPVKGFIGQIRGEALAASNNYQKSVLPDNIINQWDISNLPEIAGTGTPEHYAVGAFEYNDTAYWITRNISQGIAGAKIQLFFQALADKTFGPFAVTWTPPFSTSGVDIITDPLLNYALDVKDFLLHKERLWIATYNTLYFSKATDPSVFAAPDGGFFKFPGKKINQIVTLNDSVYIFTDNSVHQLSYSDDPNTDSSLRTVVDNIGGKGACVFRSTVYFINDDGIFSLANNRANKEFETDFYAKKLNDIVRLIPYKNYIYVLYRSSINSAMPGVAFTPTVIQDQTGVYYPNVFGINMDKNHIYALDFKDQYDNSGGSQGFVVDMMPTFKAKTGSRFIENSLVIMTNLPQNSGSTGPNATAHIATFYVMKDPDIYPPENFDLIRNSAGVLTPITQAMTLEVDSYVPDGSEYLMKKYRNLLVSGRFPYFDLATIKFAGDNADYSASIPVRQSVTNVLAKGRKFFPFRFGVNKRARSMSVKIESARTTLVSTPFDQDTGVDPGNLVIEDMRFLWSYTGKVPESKTLVIP